MKYVVNQMPTYIEQVIYELSSQAYRIPIGHLSTVLEYIEQCDIEFDHIDQRHEGKDVDTLCDWDEKIILRDYQRHAVDRAKELKRGLIVIPARGGKTLTASKLIQETGKKTLWLTHNKPLFNQTHDSLTRATGRQWHRIGAGRQEFTMNGDYFICMVQTLKNRPKMKEWFTKNIGLVIIDECHHTPSSTFLEVIDGFTCKSVIGLTATPFRQDGWDKLIPSALGDTLYEVGIDQLRDTGVLIQPTITPVYTTFTGLEEADLRDVSGLTYTELIDALVNDYNRNSLIAHTVYHTFSQGMLVTKRVEHAEHLTEMLRNLGIEVDCITGSTKGREEKLNSFKRGDTKVLVASIQLVQEGLDLPNLEQIYFCTPVKGDVGGATGSTVQQAVSRVMTSDPNNPHKQSEVFFFVDYDNDMLSRQWATVRKTLKRMGIKVPRKPRSNKAQELEDMMDLLNL